MYKLKSGRRQGTMQLCAMQEYGVLYSRKKNAERMIAEVEAEEKKEVPFTRDLKKYLDTLEVGMQQWLGMYINLSGECALGKEKFEAMLKRKNYI